MRQYNEKKKWDNEKKSCKFLNNPKTYGKLNAIFGLHKFQTTAFEYPLLIINLKLL